MDGNKTILNPNGECMSHDRLDKQIQFIMEIDKLKGILRRNWVTGTQRQENSAEHSWHIALMALLLAEHTSESLDLPRVLKMLLIHDLVEIDAGDTFHYDQKGSLDKADREQKAADRIFGLLPEDQRNEVRQLWDEFEQRTTPESRFANAVDRLHPVLMNYHQQGNAWLRHRITHDQVISRNQHIADASPSLWEYARSIIDDAAAKGYLLRSGSVTQVCQAKPS
jgi:putative hydrolase of HD superfamily